MKSLSKYHERLKKGQESKVINAIGGSTLDFKAILISMALISGVFCGANAWKGTSSDRVQFCVVAPSKTKYCADENNRPYQMSKWQWERWNSDGMPKAVIYNDLISATNRQKPLWALGAFLSFGIAGTLLRYMQDAEREYLEYESINKAKDKEIAAIEAELQLLEPRRAVSISRLELQSEIEMLASDRSLTMQQAEILGQAEVEIAKLTAKDAIFDAETAGMTDEQKREYLEIIRNQNTPFLTQSDASEGTHYHNSINISLPASNNDKDVVTDVLERVAREDGSIALCGDPGTGKSTITREFIRQVMVNCPKAELYALSVKNDSFCGLRESGRVIRFMGEDALDNARRFFKQVERVYEERLSAPEEHRHNLTPYVVILDDWLAIAAKLNKHSVDELGFDFSEILFNILTIGREYNMKFFVNLHSLNLGAIGIKGMDQNTRKCLRLLLLGNRYQKDGRYLDAYGVIEQAITGNQVITHSKDKESVREQYTILKERSREMFQPILFAFIGGYYIGLVPKFNEQLPPPPQPTPIEFTKPGYGVDETMGVLKDELPELNDEIERIFKAHLDLSPVANKVLEIIQAGTQPVSFDSIRKSRRWESSPKTDEIREAINELYLKETIYGTEEKGYSAF